MNLPKKGVVQAYWITLTAAGIALIAAMIGATLAIAENQWLALGAALATATFIATLGRIRAQRLWEWYTYRKNNPPIRMGERV